MYSKDNTLIRIKQDNNIFIYCFVFIILMYYLCGRVNKTHLKYEEIKYFLKIEIKNQIK